jgi:hypothetical protein
MNQKAMELRERFYLELEFARANRPAGNSDKEWQHLERAHVLGQFYPWKHLYVHILMIRFSFVNFRIREIIGQIPRLILSVPGSVTGLAPKGNTGGSDVGIFEPMEFPDDLKVYF